MSSKPSSNPKVSIIVPCWGHPELAKELIKSIATTQDISFELILVDNGGGVEGKDFPDWVRVIKPNHNLGFSGGNNLGLKYAKGMYILFLNNDVKIEHTAWLKKLLTPLEQNHNLIIGHQLVKDNEFTRYRGEMHDYINGWCILATKKAVDEIGGFDPGFGVGWFEDVWFSISAQSLGYELKEVKTDIVHLGSKTIMDGRIREKPTMKHASSYYKDKILKEFYRGENLRIVFLCEGNYQFSDVSLEGKGVGGAETSLILLTRELAKMGHLVDVYNHPEKIGEQNGVNYFHLGQFNYTDYADCVIIFRNPIPNISKINSPFKIFWSCDQYTSGDYTKDIFPYVDKIICISPYHMNYFKKRYFFSHKKLMYFDLGVNMPDYQQGLPKIENQLLFCSVPERGLSNLAKYFPLIKKQFPNVTLRITSDYRLWGAEPLNEKFKEMFSAIGNVFYHGKVPRKELIEIQKTSEIMVYPGDYDENFCVAAVECMAAGTVPIVSDIGALKTTVGQGGIVIDGTPRDGDYEKKFVENVCNLLTDRVKLKQYATVAQKVTQDKYDWRLLARDWHTLIYESSRNNMVDLRQHLYPFVTKNLNVLDLGCGNYTSNISVQTPLIQFKSLTGVEIWKKDLDETRSKDFLTKKLDWYEEEILLYLEKNKDKKFDVIMLFDVLEHFKKEDGLRVLRFIEGMVDGRILIFMPLGEHTLEANDGRVEAEGNNWQKHLSQWEVQEWKDLGYDVGFLKGFHHSGKLDAAWIIKDFTKGKPYMKKCSICDQNFNSSYFLERHKVSHGLTEDPTMQKIKTNRIETEKNMRVILYLKKKIDLSVNKLNFSNTNILDIPYEQFPDISRMISEGYGNIIERSEMKQI